MYCTFQADKVPKPETTPAVIETKPPTTGPPVDIKPSKTEPTPKTSEKKVIQEKAKEPVKKSSVEIKSSPASSAVWSSVVEVRGGEVLEVTPQISSKVQVKEGPKYVKSDVVSTKVGLTPTI